MRIDSLKDAFFNVVKSLILSKEDLHICSGFGNINCRHHIAITVTNAYHKRVLFFKFSTFMCPQITISWTR